MSRTGTTTRDRAGASRQEPARREQPSVVRGRTRERSQRKRRLRALLVVPLLAALAWVLWASPVLAVRRVQVDGVVSLTGDEVRDAAGVATGTPLLRVDVDAARDRVARLPQVAAVEVTRGWPQTVVVTVAERVPVAVVTDGGTRRLVDAGGVVFETITGTAPDGVVPLDVPDPGPEDAATTAALGALTALPPDVRDQVTGVAATSPDAVTLTLTDGRSVLWGSAAQTERKAEVLGALLEQIDAGTLDPAGTLDVSTPDSVVLR